MALPSRDYRDPLEVLIERESQTCKGCTHQRTSMAFGMAVTICTRTDERGKQRQHGTRCRDYSEGGK